MTDNAFEGVHGHDSAPTVPLTDVQKVRFTELAGDLEDARIQAYIEANFGIQALKLLQAVIPMLVSLA